jgi:hypothetical protein
MSDPAIVAAIIGAGALLLGSALTLFGGIVIPLLSQRLTSKAERRKIFRDKIEEMYLLSNQVEKWASWYLSGIQRSGDRMLSILYNPIDRLEMLVRLYIPSFKTSIDAYLSAVNDLSKLYTSLKQPGGVPDKLLKDFESYRAPTQDELENILHQGVRPVLAIWVIRSNKYALTISSIHVFPLLST